MVRLCSPCKPLLLGNASCETKKKKKRKMKRRESVGACCTGGLSIIQALLLRNLSLYLWPVYSLADEVCTPTGRLSPAVAAAQTRPGVVASTLLSHVCLHKGAATPPPPPPPSGLALPRLASGTKGPLAG